MSVYYVITGLLVVLSFMLGIWVKGLAMSETLNDLHRGKNNLTIDLANEERLRRDAEANSRLLKRRLQDLVKE